MIRLKVVSCYSPRMKVCLIAALLVTSSFSFCAPDKPRLTLQRSVAQCLVDGNAFSIPDTGVAEVTTMDEVIVRGQWIDPDTGKAVFSFWRGGKRLFSKRVGDLSNPNGSAIVFYDRHWLALTYSDGGAIGNFHTLIFHTESDGTIRDLSSSMLSVIRDFSSRHNCKTRGNNYQAYQWRNGDELLLRASVYPTGDCKELGYTEGYILQASTGKILNRYTEHELIRLPDICTYNYYDTDREK